MNVKVRKKKFKRFRGSYLGLCLSNPQSDLSLEEMAKPLFPKLQRMLCRYRAKADEVTIIYRPSFGICVSTVALKVKISKNY